MRSSGRTVTAVARELGISSESLRGWVKKAAPPRTTDRNPARYGPPTTGTRN
ncbi:transposase [Streptomyces sp. NPDC058256]|uniref:transposase n=1 Tax=Streptomyces sp. NPDC058256 TaxID=3346408 RepID=UPI0036EE352F